MTSVSRADPSSPARPPDPGVLHGHRRRRPGIRMLVTWLTDAAALMLLSAVLASVTVDSFEAALLASALIALVNAFVWPLIIRLALPFTVLTLGLGVLVLNGAVVLAVAAIDKGMHVRSLGAGVVVAIVLTAATTLVTSLLAIDDNDFFDRNVVRRRARRGQGTIATDVPGLLFLEIDGLAHDVLVRAMRDGNAPTMARWMRSGAYRLARWETDWSSQTGACQAGLLHGDNHDMPAFRWWEKDRGAAIVTNHPKDAMELERRHSDGRGLLFSDGASRANILSGDAPHSLLTMSTVMVRDRPGRIGQDYFAYFANPYNFTRTLTLVAAEIASELASAAQQRRLDVQPRVHRGFVYAIMRAWAAVIQRDLQVEAVIADMYAGRPVTYTTFLAYDEVAHHSGIERPETLLTLRRVDRQLAPDRRGGREHAAPVPARRPVRPRPVAGHDVPRPLRPLARGPRPPRRGLHRHGRHAEPPGRGARLPRGVAHRGGGERHRRGPGRARRDEGPPGGRRGAARARRGPGRAGGRGAARDRRDGVRLPRARVVPARAGARHARGPAGALPGRRPHPARPSRGSDSCSSAPKSTARS